MAVNTRTMDFWNGGSPYKVITGNVSTEDFDVWSGDAVAGGGVSGLLGFRAVKRLAYIFQLRPWVR